MRVLLDTNIIIHREASRVLNQDIGVLFYWIDKLHYTKCVHPLTADELNRNINADTVKTMQLKLANYQVLKTEAPLHQKVKDVSDIIDIVRNDFDDTKLLNEVFCDRVDILISEDKKVHAKAGMLGISDRVFKIETFLEKVTVENPDFINYKVLSVKKDYFGAIKLQDAFFDGFREDYDGFDKWFNKKSDEIAYVCYHNNILSAFLFIKVEDENENYSDINPPFAKKKRLKIGTFKVASNGFKLGERFSTSSGEEKVYIRDFSRNVDEQHPKFTFPRLSKTSDVYVVPIYPEYHTELFPDSILRTESPLNFVENEPHRNSLSKVYISHSLERNLKPSDIILFYRTGGYYAGVATTIGIVESIKTDIKSEDDLIQLCRTRTVLKNDELKKFWTRYKTNKPFIVNFLYAYSLPKRPNLKLLNELGVIPDIKDMPRGFRKIDRNLFLKLAKISFKK